MGTHVDKARQRDELIALFDRMDSYGRVTLLATARQFARAADAARGLIRELDAEIEALERGAAS